METRRVSRVHRVRPADIPEVLLEVLGPLGIAAVRKFYGAGVGSQGVVDAGACSRFYRQKFLNRSGASSV